jgi:hypothetical protein
VIAYEIIFWGIDMYVEVCAMKILGFYMDKNWRSARMNYGARIALEITAAWTEGYSDKEDETKFFVIIRSGCYMFHIKSKEDEYLSKERADNLVESIVTKDIVNLDDEGMALYSAIDTTPDEYYVRNALDENYDEIPLEVAGV